MSDPNDSNDPKDGDQWMPGDAALDPSGQRVGSLAPRPSLRGAPEPPDPERPTGAFLEHEGPLELAHAPRREEPVPPDEQPRSWQVGEPAPRRSILRPLAVLLVVVLVAAGAWVLFGRSLKREVQRTLNKNPAILYVDSVPGGAEVIIEGRSRGTTPLVMENHFAGEEITIELRRAGYRTWRGSFRGGQEARIDARLKRRGAGKAP